VANIENLDIRKLFQSGIHLYGAYPSNINNGSHNVYLKFKNILSKLASKLSEKELDQLEHYIGQGLMVDDIFIFGKQGGASTCCKCLKEKYYHADLDEKLRVRLPKVWQHLHL
jgi:hypothetical protein